MTLKKLNIPDVPGVSLVAYYGEKPLELKQLIINLQQLLQAELSSQFIPYAVEQVHATIIGCEGLKTELGIINKWYYQLRNEIKYLNYRGVIHYLLNADLFPLSLCFAGYQLEINYQFLSRNQHPANRSFQLQTSKDAIIPIMIGWSLEERVIISKIDNLRRNLQQYNYLHKYHKLPQDIDNDVYLRLGTISKEINTQSIAIIQQKINQYLQNLTPVIIPLSQNNLTIVKYQDLSLSLTTTKTYSLTELKNNLNTVKELYQEKTN